jgi:translation initiation factor 3 subunit I
VGLTFILDTVAVDPTGKGYASGGEDGYVRVHQFDKGYFDFTYEVERQARAAGQM